MQPFHDRCIACRGKVKQVTKADPVKLIAAMVLGLLLVAGIGYGASGTMRQWLGGLLGGSRLSDDRGRPANDNAALRWSIEADQGGERRTLAPGADFVVKNGAYRSKDTFHEGDRLRIQATTDNGMKTYVFYRNGSEAKRFLVDDSGQVSVPSEGQWFKLDSRPGTEEFILVASNNPQPKLEEMSGAFDPVALDNEIHDLKGRKGVELARVQLRHE